MVAQSVDTIVDGGNDDGDHLSLWARDGRAAEHQRLIQSQMVEQALGMQAVDLQDVIDATMLPIGIGVVDCLQFAFRGFWGEGVDPGDSLKPALRSLLAPHMRKTP